LLGAQPSIDLQSQENASQNYNDPFIKKIRTELKSQGFKKKFKVIFSSELPMCLEKGSFEGVTGSFGLMMASVTIQKLVNKLQK
jgi:tRNA A37 threonylcarbamoyladenosine dehydratase